MRKLFVIILVSALLFSFALTQRGGGRSRSSSRSRGGSSWGGRRSSSSWSKGRSSSFWGWSSNSTSYNQTSGDSTIDSGTGYWILGGMVALVGGCGYVGYEQNKKKRMEREEKIKTKCTIYEGYSQTQCCTLDDGGKMSLRDWFMSQKWRVDFRNQSGFHDFCNLTIEDLKQKSSNSYTLKMSGKDSEGRSELQGVVVHRSDYFGIYLVKTYDNMNKAGQTDGFQWLIYDGVQQGERFVGKWFYEGFQHSSEYSGTWEMSHS